MSTASYVPIHTVAQCTSDRIHTCIMYVWHHTHVKNICDRMRSYLLASSVAQLL